MKNLLFALVFAFSAVCHAGSVTEVKSLDQFETEAIKGGPSVVLVTAEWCGPCKVFHPTYERLAKDMSMRFLSMDVDNPNLFAFTAQIPSYPTVLVVSSKKTDEGIELLVCPAAIGAASYEKVKENILKCIAQMQ